MDARLGQKLIRELLNPEGEEGFSLIELIVVMAVITVLSNTGIIGI